MRLAIPRKQGLNLARPVIRRPNFRKLSQSFALTFVATALLAGFLSPLMRSASLSVKDTQQINTLGSPIYPSDPEKFVYKGRSLDVYQVPIDGTTRNLALVQGGRASSQFVDPANPDAGIIVWQGSYRALSPAWVSAAHPENYSNAWNLINFPRLLFNTVLIALIGMVGTLLSCTVVAYGFARFRFPGRNVMFLLLISTIFLPATVTIVPTYTTWLWLGALKPDIGYLAWAPLLVPTFFANAYDVFLMRQYFLTIPREMDEAAAMDGAGPVRTLVSVILPQAWPVVIAVGIFHFIYSWNDFFGPLIYLGSKPELQPLALGLQQFNAIRAVREPGLIQASTIIPRLIPVAIFVIFQRVFTRGIVITGVER
jgi:multiple sugar transport system permease protein